VSLFKKEVPEKVIMCRISLVFYFVTLTIAYGKVADLNADLNNVLMKEIVKQRQGQNSAW